MKSMRKILMPAFTTALLLMLFTNIVSAQTLTQSLKGKVFDNETQTPLIGATVVVLGTKPLLGAITDINGYYKISNVPIGRYNIQFHYLGYNPITLSEIQVTSGKEVVNNIGLTESVSQIKEVSVKGYSQKDKPLNSMALISAKTFTVEETRRYAGGMDDPARLVSAFAGVTTGNISDNAISIRGNSPKGVSWRLEGVEIPNPSHFSGANVAGGGFVTIFSSQLLANSDFFTGAFPAEYGNALAGVFDMKLRNGNSDKREHTVQAGIMGIDLASEGPFKKGKNASYLFNYRYSTFSLLTTLGIIPSGEVPTYQDLSFKLNFPTQKAGVFSLWGIGAIDNSIKKDVPDSSKWKYDFERVKYNWGLKTGAMGLSHKLITGSKTYLNTVVAVSGIENIMDAKRLNNNLVSKPYWYFTDKSGKVSTSTFINHKFSAKHTMKAGINYHTLIYKLDLNSAVNDDSETFQNTVNENNSSNYSEFYIQSKFDISENLSINAGINTNYFALNNQASVDPRFSLKWGFSRKHALSFGYGKHSQLEEIKIYLFNKKVNGVVEYPNKSLKVSQAHHFVLGYDWSINDNLRLKVEPYFQYLYGIPGISKTSYSLINFQQDWSFRNSLENNTYGQNIGIDFTLERFLNNNYYYLLTASVFDSKYLGDDGVWRNTRYNRGFVMNVLVGKEFFIKNNRVIGVNGRLNYMGGERTSPVLVQESLKQKSVIYDESKAFEKQLPAIYNLDLSFSYRINKMKHSSVWSLQIKNALGSPMLSGYFYNYKTREIQNEEIVIIVPNISYKIEF